MKIMDLNVVYKKIDDDARKFVEDLVKLVKQPSISAKGEGIEQCSILTEEMMKEIGISTRILKTEKCNPVVYGEIISEKSPKTLLFYNHYDVQPPEPLEKWMCEPFGGEIINGRIYGRGASDNKGNLVSRLKAIEAILGTMESVPVNLKFFVDGEEEIGSPNLEPLIKENRDLFSADAVIWESGGTDRQYRPNIYLGLKGVLSLELQVSCASRDVHSANAPLVPNAAWRLLWALNQLKDQQENILVKDFNENVQPATSEEIQCLEAIPFEEEEFRHELGLHKLLLGKSGIEALKSLLYDPTCTINGIRAGYTAEGSKTVLPHEAFAKLDFRLVPNQKPDEIFQKIFNHLGKHGFQDVKIIRLGSTEPTRTPVNDPFVKLVTKTAEQVYGKKAVIYPTSAGSGPMHLFHNFLGCPVISVGCSHPEANAHAPNENLRISSFIKGIRFMATIINNFSIA